MGIYIDGFKMPEGGYRTIEIAYDADGHPMAITDGGDVFDVIPAADVRPVVMCCDCKHNNACLTQAFVEDASRVPFDRNTFFCADGKRADDA